MAGAVRVPDWTMTLAVADAELYAVIPPLGTAAWAVAPFALLSVWFHARNTKVAGPVYVALGTNLTIPAALSSVALLSANAPNAVQVVPAFVENCQAPLALSRPVTAMPRSAKPVTSTLSMNSESTVPSAPWITQDNIFASVLVVAEMATADPGCLRESQVNTACFQTAEAGTAT